MARPRKVLGVRFKDVAGKWEQALQNAGLRYAAPTHEQATHFQHRLNAYRKALRDEDPEGFTMLDEFVVRKQGTIVTILPRPGFEEERMSTLDGRPLADSQQDIPASYWEQTIKDRQTVNSFRVAEGQLPFPLYRAGESPQELREQNKYDPNAPYKPDPTKPFLDE